MNHERLRAAVANDRIDQRAGSVGGITMTGAGADAGMGCNITTGGAIGGTGRNSGPF